MKVALVIFRFGPSHGSILQTYALTRTLERLGHEVNIIDRQPSVDVHGFITCLRRAVKGVLKRNLSSLDFYFGDYSPALMRSLNGFIDRELRGQTITLNSEAGLRKIGKGDYDAFIVGSDQTWRPKYVYNVYNYYLNFVPQDRKVKRIAYAPSFGTSDWEYTEEQEKKCKSLIQLFDGVSVRESDGAEMCKKHFGIEPVHVLDPTMLLSASDYKLFVNEKSEEKYVGYNYLDFSDKKKALADYVSDVLKLPNRQLISMDDNNLSVKQRIAPSIETWLSGIANSEFVLVDSFHATVFSIIFHKHFLTVGNASRGLSRFTSLLKALGLEERMILSEHEINKEIILKPIDWNDVDSRLEQMIYKSIDFLRENINN